MRWEPCRRAGEPLQLAPPSSSPMAGPLSTGLGLSGPCAPPGGLALTRLGLRDTWSTGQPRLPLVGTGALVFLGENSAAGTPSQSLCHSECVILSVSFSLSVSVNDPVPCSHLSLSWSICLCLPLSLPPSLSLPMCLTLSIFLSLSLPVFVSVSVPSFLHLLPPCMHCNHLINPHSSLVHLC